MLVAKVATTSFGRKLLITAASACVLFVFTFVMIVGVVATMLGANPTDSPGSSQPSATALADIPSDMLALYMEAGKMYGIDWAIIAAIGWRETNHCRSTAPGVSSGNNSAGAGGCMQFLQDTFDQYGVDGDGDGKASRYSRADSVMSTANYLKASGAPGNYHDAIFAYNHAEWYVASVLSRAGLYRGALQIGLPGVGSASVQSVIQSAAELDGMRVPYNYGGGHVTPAQPTSGQQGAYPGLDCSSTVSWVLQHAGISVPTLDSTGFMSWGDPGPGQFVTLYANPSHIFMSIVVNGRQRYFGTSGFGHPQAGTGAAWFTMPVHDYYIAGFTQRHPPGM